MGCSGASFVGGASWPSCGRASAQVPFAPCCGRAAVRGEDRLPVAAVAGELSSVAELSPAVPRVARQRRLGADQRGTGEPEPSPPRPGLDTDDGHHRLAKRQNGVKRGQRGFDAGKKIKGRKRHIAVDRDGHLLAAVVHSAGVQDSAGAFGLLTRLHERVATVRTVFADGGYQGKLLPWAAETLGISMEIVKRTHDKGFQVLRKRWVVERSFAWLGWNRRLSKDYELNPKSAECFLFLASSHLLLKRT